MTVKILVVDDEPTYVTDVLVPRIVNGAREAVEPIPLTSTQLEEEIGKLHDRQRAPDNLSSIQTVFDAADAAIVDYNLRYLHGAAGLLTGEDVARLIRRYTLCGPIVSLNRDGRRVYSLQLSTLPSSGSDLSVYQDDLAVRGLWDWGQGDGYRPWVWPALLNFIANFPKRVQFCMKQWEEARLEEVLKIPKIIRKIFPADVARFGGDILSMTIKELCATSLLPPADRGTLPKENQARVAASFIGTWLEHTVLPSQEVLIDAPHVVQLYPLLFEGQASEEALTRLSKSTNSNELPLKTPLLADAESGLGVWTNRPTWWTSAVQGNREIPKEDGPASNFQFCEDSSRFVAKGAAIPFKAGGQFSLRFVQGWSALGLPPETYQPQSKLAL